MTINQFAQKVTRHEGLKKEVNIAQTMEILKVINKLTGGILYAIIKTIKEK